VILIWTKYFINISIYFEGLYRQLAKEWGKEVDNTNSKKDKTFYWVDLKGEKWFKRNILEFLEGDDLYEA